ncbi:uncharacterized protein [Acropora muricata]|uniref:uncharacterized protein n=1 Tax=Acropora muricata TaxID=159855 RepID=UPI0034E4B875
MGRFDLLLITFLAVCYYETSVGLAVSVAKPSASQVKYLDYEIGASIHFNMQTFARTMRPGHVVSPDTFNPTKLSTDEWLKAASSFGAKYAILTLDHFSGFLLWPTETNYNYSVKNSQWKNKTGDVAWEFMQSCEKYGLKHAFYYSVHENWYMDIGNYRSPTPEAQAIYNKLVEQQMRELFDPKSKYSNPFLIWFDAGIIPGVSPNIGPILRTVGNNTICMQCPSFAGNQGVRWVGDEQAVAPLPLWYSVKAGECGKDNIGDPLGEQFCPPFCDTVIREHYWFWKPNTTDRVKNVSTLVREYLTSVGRGCHLILNLDPDPNGLVEDEDIQAYSAFGKAIQLLYEDEVITLQDQVLKLGKEMVLSSERPFSKVNGSLVIMEDVAQFGQLVAEYQVRFKSSQGWIEKPLKGSTIGQKAIIPFPRVSGGVIFAVGITITKLVTTDSSIMLREVSIYDWSRAAKNGYV